MTLPLPLRRLQPLAAESWRFITVCAVVFSTMAATLALWPRPVKLERTIEKKIMEGRALHAPLLVPVWLRKGWVLGTGIAGLALLAAPWLGRRRKTAMRFVPELATPGHRWAGLLACVALAGFASWQNYPRLFHSLWADEEFNASVFILPDLVPQPDGTLHAVPKPWATTLWDMRKPTNHVGYSVLARLSQETFFKAQAGPNAAWFSEALLRLPVFIGGLLLIPVMGWSLRVWGLQPWWAVGMLVLHPWFVRFGVDGRGYGFVILSTAGLLGLLGRALQTGRWGWWAALGAVQFLALWSSLQAVYPLAGINLAALTSMAMAGPSHEGRRLLLGRWIVASLLAGLLVILMLTPCWPQLQAFMKTGEMMGVMDGAWWRDSFNMLLFGQFWDAWAPAGHPFANAMSVSYKHSPLLFGTALVAVPALLFMGIAALLRSRAHWPLLCYTIGAPCLMILHMRLKGYRPYDWYLGPFLPALVLLVAAASTWLIAQRARFASIAILTVGLGVYASATQRQRSLLRDHPLELGRESVADARNVTNPLDPEWGKAVISAGMSPSMGCYDPVLIRLGSAEELRGLMAEADRSGKQLSVNVSALEAKRSTSGMKEQLGVLEDGQLFEKIAVLPGQASYLSRDVFRYRRRALP